MINKKICISGYYGYNNVGDDLLLLSITNHLLQIDTTYKITITVNDRSNLPLSLSKKINCIESTVYNQNKLKRLINTIKFEIDLVKKNDIYIYGGGTRLFETQNRTYQSLLVKYLFLKYNAVFLKKKIYHLGVGIGNIDTRFGKWLFKKILNLSDIIHLRDLKSYEKSLGVIKNKNKLILGSDLFFLNEKKLLNIQNDRTSIGCSFFNYYGYITKDTEDKISFKGKCVHLIKELLDLNPEIDIYLFSFQKEFGGKDESFNNELVNQLSSKRVFHVRYSTDTDKILNLIKSLDVSIGMRYHFCLVSLFYEIPTFGISYQPKVMNEFISLNISDYCYNIENFKKLTNEVKYFISNLNKEKDQFKESFSLISERKLKLRNDISQILNID